MKENLLNVEWNDTFIGKTAGEMWESFSKRIQMAVTAFVPKKKVGERCKPLFLTKRAE